VDNLKEETLKDDKTNLLNECCAEAASAAFDDVGYLLHQAINFDNASNDPPPRSTAAAASGGAKRAADDRIAQEGKGDGGGVGILMSIAKKINRLLP
jgi:hypothetical protein